MRKILLPILGFFVFVGFLAFYGPLVGHQAVDAGAAEPKEFAGSEERISELEKERDRLRLELALNRTASPLVRTTLASREDEDEDEDADIKAEITRLRVKNEQLLARIELLQSELIAFRQEEPKTVVQEFLQLPEARELSPEERESVVEAVIQPLGKVPSGWEVKMLARPAREFSQKHEEWLKQWIAVSPIHRDFEHPDVRRLLEENEKFFREWREKLAGILSPEDVNTILPEHSY